MCVSCVLFPLTTETGDVQLMNTMLLYLVRLRKSARDRTCSLVGLVLLLYSGTRGKFSHHFHSTSFKVSLAGVGVDQECQTYKAIHVVPN